MRKERLLERREFLKGLTLLGGLSLLYSYVPACLRSAEVGDRQIVMELYRTEYLQDEQRLEMATAQSVLRDVVIIQLPSLLRWAHKVIASRTRRGKRAVANEWQEMIRTGSVRNRAELAERMGVSRAPVSQVLGPAAT